MAARVTAFPFTLALILVAAPHLDLAASSNAPERTGFPRTLPGAGSVKFSTPVVADLGYGGKQIIVGTSGIYSGTSYTSLPRLWVINGDGNIRWSVTLPSEIASSPAVADLDGDGLPEIVVGCGSNTDLAQPGAVFAFRRDGATFWSFSPKDTDGNGQPDHVWSTPALGDLDGDGLPDVVFGSWDFYVYALKGSTGLPLTGWPVLANDSVWSSPALADLDGDGTLEVIIGADSNEQGPPLNIKSGGAMWVFRANGTLFPGFPKFVTDPPGVTPVGIFSSPAVGDIDGDGCPEIVVGRGTSTSTGGRQMYAWKNDGSLVPGWPVTLDGHPTGSPLLADLAVHGNGQLDVVITDDSPWVYAFRGDGTQLFKVRPKTYNGIDAIPGTISGAIAAQIGEVNPAIVVGSVGLDVCILSKTGTQISANGTNAGLIYSTGGPVAGPVLADLDGTGTLTLIAASMPRFASTYDDAAVFAWPVGAVGALPWPQFHKNEKRTGWTPAPLGGTPASCKPALPLLKLHTLTPCRVADSRQSGNLTYGGPAYQVAGDSMNPRTITFTGVCGVPSTAKAVVLNVTASLASAPGTLRLYPAGDGPSTGTSLSYRAVRDRANNAIIPLSYDGRGNLTVKAEGATGQVQVILDVTGYFE